MLLRDYLQKYHWISRRRITDAINQWTVFVNNIKIENYKAEIKEKDLLIIASFKINESVSFEDEHFDEILLFNKPMWYTCSKSDPHNKTFYELLPKEFVNKYYYIWRLDKNSRWLMILTTNSKLVHEYEHPSKEVEKTYTVSLNKNFNWNLKDKILLWIRDSWELLRTKSLEKWDNNKIIITLNEWKKRHIRRIFKSLWYEVTDLQRIRIWNYVLWDLKEGEYQAI
jgi:23S rRNA pseudouridine2605 synthase